MEYERQIEIKLEGNNCIINFPKEKNISRQNSSLTNIDDISLNISVTSEEETISKNINQVKAQEKSNSKQYLYSNEKSKLEITYLSIFNSEMKSESSNIKTPLLLLNYKSNADKIKEQQKKDSVVKKLNFDKINNDLNSNIKKENEKENEKENKYNYNSEIPNINIRKLPMIKKNNIIKKISKNLNKEYFIHEKIYSSNKNMQRVILDKKLKENSIKNSNINYPNKNRTQIIENNNSNILNNESFNINKYQITENYTTKDTKGNLNFLSNKADTPNINNNSNTILNKCSSKPNLSYMRLKLNNILKINSKEKPKNNSLKELEIMPKIISNENINNIRTKKLAKNQIIYPSLTSGNFNPNLNTLNSFNKSANNNNKIKSFNLNENSNLKTPLILNKQIILKTPKTNSYSCSTSYSAKNNNKIQNDINMSSDIKKSLKEKDPILIKIEAHNSLLKNFLMNKNNFKEKENKENISSNINNKEIKIQKFNTDFKLPINKNKKFALLTERNLKNNNINNTNDLSCLNKRKINDWQNLFKNKEYNFDFKNKIL